MESEDFLLDFSYGHASAFADGAVVDAGGHDGFSPGAVVADGRHVEGFVFLLRFLAGDVFPRLCHFANGFGDFAPVPDFVFADFVVVESARVDRFSPGAEEAFRRRVDARILGRVIMGIERFFIVMSHVDVRLDHFRGPDFFKHGQ